MKIRLILWTVGLVAVMISSACAPALAETNPDSTPTLTALPAATEAVQTATQLQVPPEAPTLAVEPIATSRGPNLEATDPTTVGLAS